MARTWFRLSMLAAIGALAFGVLALHAAPATADDGDEVSVALIEARVAKPTTVRAEPAPTAAGVTSLDVDEAIYVMGHITDKDAVMWYQIATLDGTPIGWLPSSEVVLVTAGESD